MITGVKNWNDRSVRYEQNENATESIIKKVLRENGITKKGWLESCGASAFCTIMEAMGFLTEADYPVLNGETIQFDDWIMMYMNDPKRDRIFLKGTTFDNHVFRNYPKLAEKLFPTCVPVYKHWDWKDITAEITKGHGAQICLKNPSHYIAGLAYNDIEDVILYSDSWTGRKDLVNGGWHEKLTKEDYDDNTFSSSVVYSEI